jgi:hypothetical protein
MADTNPFQRIALAPYQSQYVPAPIQEYMTVFQNLQGRYNKNKAQMDKLDLMAEQMAVLPGDEQVKERLIGNIRQTVDELSQRGDAYEHYKDAVNASVMDYMKDEQRQAAESNYKRYLEDRELKQKLEAEGKSVLDFGDFTRAGRGAFSTVYRDPDTGEEKIRSYNAGIQEKLDWDKRKEEMFDDIPESGRTAILGAANMFETGQITYSDFQGITSDVIKRYAPLALNRYVASTNEGAQEYKAYLQQGKSDEEVQQAILDDLVRVGMERVGGVSRTRLQFLPKHMMEDQAGFAEWYNPVGPMDFESKRENLFFNEPKQRTKPGSYKYGVVTGEDSSPDHVGIKPEMHSKAAKMLRARMPDKYSGEIDWSSAETEKDLRKIINETEQNIRVNDNIQAIETTAQEDKTIRSFIPSMSVYKLTGTGKAEKLNEKAKRQLAQDFEMVQGAYKDDYNTAISRAGDLSEEGMMYKPFTVMDKEGNLFMVGNPASQVEDPAAQVKMRKNLIFNKSISAPYEEHLSDVPLPSGKVKQGVRHEYNPATREFTISHPDLDAPIIYDNVTANGVNGTTKITDIIDQLPFILE